MKTFKTILVTLVLIFVLSSAGGYFYFDKKFTPEDNYLAVKNESGKIPIKWEGDKKAILLAINIAGDSATYYMQFDTGSPYTVFYKKSIAGIPGIKYSELHKTSQTTLNLGDSQISSNRFKTLDFGQEYSPNDSVKIIGTIGTDLMENTKTIINFREQYIVFNVSEMPELLKEKWIDFDFSKRKIIIKGLLRGQEEKFLFDSGTSGYELLTNKQVFDELKLPNSSITTEKGKSWENTLITYTATCNSAISFKNYTIPLQHVTYVEGFSKTQFLLMKLSGMTGMLGNKIFSNSNIYIDGKAKRLTFD